MRRFGVLLFALFIPLPTSAYTTAPVRLWELVAEADQIVVATVDGIEEPPARREREDEIPTLVKRESVAHLSVLETWEGHDLDWLDVVFPTGLLCPAPPVDGRARTVLALLKARTDFRFSIIACSYVTHGEGIDTLRELVAEARRVQEDSMSDWQRRAWLVSAASRRVTRWSALYELAPQSDEMQDFYDETNRAVSASLSAEEVAAIANGFVQEPSLDQTLLMILAVLGAHESDAFDATAIAVFDAVMSERPIPRWAKKALPRLFKRMGIGPPGGSAVVRLSRPLDPAAWTVHQHALDSDLAEIWKEGRSKMRFGALPALELEPPPMPFTPD